MLDNEKGKEEHSPEGFMRNNNKIKSLKRYYYNIIIEDLLIHRIITLPLFVFIIPYN